MRCDPRSVHEMVSEIVANLPESKSFTEGVQYPKVAKPKAGYVPTFVGQSFSDLVKTDKAADIASIPTKYFEANNQSFLAQTLIDLGIATESVGQLINAFRDFQAAYEKTIVSEEFKSGVPALRKPLALMTPEGTDTLPVQAQFALMLGAYDWLNQNNTNQVFQVTRAKAEFLYGQQRAQLSPNDHSILDNLGHDYVTATQNIGANVARTLGLSATADGAEYYERLVPALGMAALETLNQSDSLVIARHNWNFQSPADRISFLNSYGRSYLGAAALQRAYLAADNLTAQEENIAQYKPANSEGQVATSEHRIALVVLNTATKEYNRIVDQIRNTATKQGKSIPDLVDGYAFTTGNEYLHVIVNTQAESADNNTVASVSLTRLGRDPEADNVAPLQQPAETVVSSIKKSRGGVPKRLKRILRKLQNVEWTTSDTMTLFTAMATDHRDALLDLAGVKKVHDTDPEILQKSLEASNKDKIQAIDNVLEAQAQGALDKFYFKYKLMNHHRIMMQGKINPQNSHVTRWLLKPYKTETYTKENIHRFQLAVLMTLGYDVDKRTPAEINSAFQEAVELNNAVLSTAVNAVRAGDTAAVVRMLPEVVTLFGKEGKENISVLSALTALAAYEPYRVGETRSFQSDIPMEIDGVTNGFAINLLQFPTFDTATLERRLNQTGTYLGKKAAELIHRLSGIFQDTKAHADVYMDLGSLVVNAGDANTAALYARKVGDEQFTPAKYSEQNEALSRLYTDLANPDKYRGIVKYPFMIYQYGGGIASISQGIAKDIVHDLYTQIGKMQREYNSLSQAQKEGYLNETVRNFENDLKVLGVNVNLRKTIRGNNSSSFEFPEKDMIAVIGGLLAPRFDSALETMLGETTEHRNATVQAAEAVHAIFLQHYEKTIAEKLKEFPGRKSLTVREKNEIIREQLIDLLPQYKGPLNSADDTAFVDLTREDVPQEGSVRADFETIEYAYLNRDTQKKSTRQTTQSEREFVSPGVSALIRMIINMDASLMADTLDSYPENLMLYDAFMGTPESLAKVSKHYGQRYLQFGREHSVIEKISEQLTFAIEASDPEILTKADNWLQEFAFNSRGKNIVTLQDVVAQTNESVTAVRKAREELFATMDDRGAVSHQMFMADTGSENPDNDLSFSQRMDEMEFALEQTKQRAFLQGEVFNNLSAGVRDAVSQMITKLGINTFYERFGSYNEEFLEDYIQVARRDPRANTALAGVLGQLKATYPNTPSVPLLISILTGEGNAATVAEFEARFNERTLTNIKNNVRTELVNTMIPDVAETVDLDAQYAEDVQRLKDEMLSLAGERRRNAETLLTGSVTNNNVRSLFDKFNSVSTGDYQSTDQKQAHTDILTSAVDILSKGVEAIGNIQLSVEQIDGITQGGYDLARKKMRVSLNRLPPASVNGQSPQEVYVHELLHAVTNTVLKSEPLIQRSIRKLYDQVKTDLAKNGGYKVFLAGIDGTPSPADIEMAKKQYAYLFENPKNEKFKLDEFLAYAVTNQAMVSYLQGTYQKLPPRDPGIMGRLMRMVDVVMDALVRRLRGTTNNTAYQDMLAVVEQIVGIQTKHETKLQTVLGKVSNKLDVADERIRQRTSALASKLIKTDATGRFHQTLNAVIGGAKLVMSENAAKAKASAKVQELMSKTVRDLYLELGEGALSERLVRQLLKSKNIISKARQTTERSLIDEFNRIWKSTDGENIGVATKTAMTKVLLRTDLSSLTDISMSPKQISNLFNNLPLIAQEQKRLLKAMKSLGVSSGSRAVSYMGELGRHMATGNTELPNAHTNIYTIARDEVNQEPNAELLAYMEAYTTLVALQTLHTSDGTTVSLVKKLSDDEFAADVNENGISDILALHTSFKKDSLSQLFKNNPYQTVKGYTSERVDNLHSMKTGTKADAKKMAQEGYTEAYSLGTIPGVVSAHDTLYVSHNMPEVPFVSGIMSVTNHRHMGTSITEILAKDVNFQKQDGSVDHQKIQKEVTKIARRQARDAKNLSLTKGLKLRPIRNDQGNITDYRVMMNHSTKEQLLRPDLEFQNVFAHMHSATVDKVNTVINDKETVDALVFEQATVLPSLPNQFVDILDPKQPFYESYRRLPKEVQDYLRQYAVDGKFMVRDSIIDKVFGYQAYDLRNLPALAKESRGRLRWAAAMGHYLVKQTVSFGVDRVVIATTDVVVGNILSNIFQLGMRKINPVYTMRKMYEGYTEYRRYHDETTRIRELDLKIKSKNLGPTSSEQKERTALLTSVKANPLHRMSKAGLNSLIVEDLNDAAAGGYVKRLQKTMKAEKYDRYLDKVPSALGTIAQTLFMTRSSAPYRLSKEVVQLSDFLARYVMIEHATKVRGESFQSAMHEAINAFVLFDENMTPAIEAVNSVAGTLFTSYWMRNQRAAKSLIKQHPTTVLTAAGAQQITGIDALANINSSFYGLNFAPNMLQLDDLVVDKIVDIPLLSNLEG